MGSSHEHRPRYSAFVAWMTFMSPMTLVAISVSILAGPTAPPGAPRTSAPHARRRPTKPAPPQADAPTKPTPPPSRRPRGLAMIGCGAPRNVPACRPDVPHPIMVRAALGKIRRGRSGRHAVRIPDLPHPIIGVRHPQEGPWNRQNPRVGAVHRGRHHAATARNPSTPGTPTTTTPGDPSQHHRPGREAAASLSAKALVEGRKAYLAGRRPSFPPVGRTPDLERGRPGRLATRAARGARGAPAAYPGWILNLVDTG